LQTVSLKNGCFGLALLVSLALTLQPVVVLADAVNKPPVINHDPVTYGIKGQSLTLKAKVTDASPGVQDVTLYYALFRDAAPFRVPMKPSGLDFYVGSIDASMIKDVQTIAYYIEAQDKDGALSETPWYTIEFRKAEASTGTGVVVPPETKKDDGMSWKTVGLIGAGVAAVALGAVALGGGGGGGGSGGGGGGSTNKTDLSGTYNGAVTTCLTVNGQQPSCESHNCSIVIDSKGSVFSESLLQGDQMTGKLSGSSFILSGQVMNQGSVSNGAIDYNGTVVNGQIVGSITGSAQTSGGAGSYSGSFSAAKQ
jgi:hypothetical protein